MTGEVGKRKCRITPFVNNPIAKIARGVLMYAFSNELFRLSIYLS